MIENVLKQFINTFISCLVFKFDQMHITQKLIKMAIFRNTKHDFHSKIVIHHAKLNKTSIRLV